MNAVVLSIATFFSTSVGGLFALRFRDRLHFILSFSAGVLLGVVCFDLLPEIFQMARTQAIGYENHISIPTNVRSAQWKSIVLRIALILEPGHRWQSYLRVSR